MCASCVLESLGASVSSVSELPGPSDGSTELTEHQDGSSLQELPETAGTPQERLLLAACVLSLHLDH